MDNVVNEIEGLNIDVVFPFNLDDYVVGAKLAVGSVAKFPDLLFAKKSFNVADGKLTLDADFKSTDNSLALASKWKSVKHGFTLGADLNSRIKNYITGLHFRQDDVDFQGTKASLSTSFDTVKKKVAGFVSFKSGDTKGTVKFDGKHPSLSVSKVLDDEHEITPTIDLVSKQLSLEVLRKWAGGSLKSIFHADKADLVWRDEGVRGAWVTTAQIPFNDNAAKPKVSISRDWYY